MAKRPRPSSTARSSSTPVRKKATKTAKPRAAKKASAAKPVRAVKATKPSTKRPARSRGASKARTIAPLEVDAIELAQGDESSAATQTARPSAPVPSAPEKRATNFAIELARCCADDKCEDVVLLDVSAIRQDMDFVLIASGTSDRQMRSVLRHLEELGDAAGQPCLRTSSDERATWLLADFVDIMVHLFEPHTRSHYDLEMLWGDAPRIAWQRADQVVRDRAQLRASQPSGA